jgi:hypothetical protein
MTRPVHVRVQRIVFGVCIGVLGVMYVRVPRRQLGWI